MKRFIATAVSAAMLTGAVSTAALAADAGSLDFMADDIASTSDSISITVTADGETLSASLTALNSESGDTSLSGSVTLPASVAGEETTVSLDDVLRVVSGDTYLNVDAVLDLYQQLSGDASLTSLATMVGIDQPWLVIPKLDIPESETTEPEISEELTTALVSAISSFEMEETETSLSVSFDGDDLVVLMQNLEDLYKNHSEELNSLMTGNSAELDYKTIFADYILAAAEGINSVQPDTTVDAAVEMINGMIDSMISEGEAGLGLPTVDDATDGASVSEELAAALAEGVQVAGNVTVEQTEAGLSVNVSVQVSDADAEDTVDVQVSVVSSTEGEFTEIAAPDSATALRDVVKNVVVIYYGMMAQQETETAAE